MVEKKEGHLTEERQNVAEKSRSVAETNRETGLTEAEAAKRLAADGANELEQEKKKQGGKKLNCSDEKDLQRAEKMLISELAVVFNVTVESARKSGVEAVFTQDKEG